MKWATSLTIALLSIGCNPPRDAEGTLERIRSTGEIRAGVSESPPWIVRTSLEPAAEPRGIEADLIRDLARANNARVRWTWGTVEEHFRALERHELDVVAGGIDDKTPWGTRVGLTRPFAEVQRHGELRSHVFALPPGENGWLFAVDSHLSARKALLEALLGEASP